MRRQRCQNVASLYRDVQFLTPSDRDILRPPAIGSMSPVPFNLRFNNEETSREQSVAIDTLRADALAASG
ncbi:hypothetical protein GA0061098_102215 [Bradyrhizobium shewense]|uniref:Uncharacterized protein n=1 Tax=Bradyrhizobium shewense TaxID=1761772 RepID=A0A1C3XNW4_9BRAD|nr:hypothetical protein GA0061098_102215 [Bradyrhizobium shewense]